MEESSPAECGEHETSVSSHRGVVVDAHPDDDDGGEQRTGDTPGGKDGRSTSLIAPSSAVQPASSPSLDPDHHNDHQLQQQQQKDVDYDVVIIGTGLTASILAAALARAGQSVLHTDGQDVYGELFTTWNPSQLQQEWQKQQTQQEKELVYDPASDHPGGAGGDLPRLKLSRRGASSSLVIDQVATKSTFDILEGARVVTPYGEGRVVSLGSIPESTTDSNGSDPTLDLPDPAENPRLTSVLIQLTQWTLAQGQHPKLYMRLPISPRPDDGHLNKSHLFVNNEVLPPHSRFISKAQQQAQIILQERSRSLALDVTPGLLYAVGPAVQGLLTSGVAEYLEFKALIELLFYQPPPNQQAPPAADATNMTTGTTSPSTSSSSGTQPPPPPRGGSWERVPGNKNDVFASRLLSPMEKRRLMKFLQLTLDYATAEEVRRQEQLYRQQQQQQHQQSPEGAMEATHLESSSTSEMTESTLLPDQVVLTNWNERHLNQGRSLSRPQNKSVDQGELQILRRCIEDQVDFGTYLQEQHRLSPSLTQLVRYALALETTTTTTLLGASSPSNVAARGDLTTGEAMHRLSQYMMSLGRFGPTAFLAPMYGSGEFPQAFCRSAAVFGATYWLRRPVAEIQPCRSRTEEAATTIQSTSSEKGGETASKVNSTSSPRLRVVFAEADSENEAMDESAPKEITCSHVIIPRSAILSPFLTLPRPVRRVYRRISVLRGKPLRNHATSGSPPLQQRHVVLIPPLAMGSESAIQGLILDESTQVAPYVSSGCTVVHLTTSVSLDRQQEEMTEESDDQVVTDRLHRVLSDALSAIMPQTTDERTSVEAEEIFHVAFHYDLFMDDENDAGDVRRFAGWAEADQKGVHMIMDLPPHMVIDPHFEQGATLFKRICPGAKFLEVSSALQEKIEAQIGGGYRTGADLDEEQAVLDSALGLLGPAAGQSHSSSS